MAGWCRQGRNGFPTWPRSASVPRNARPNRPCPPELAAILFALSGGDWRGPWAPRTLGTFGMNIPPSAHAVEAHAGWQGRGNAPVSRRGGWPMRYLGWLIGLLALIGPPALAEEHRWATEGAINGRPARLVLDTGVSFPLAMQRRTMADFGVELDEARAIEPSMEGVVAGFSKAARIELPPAYEAEDAVFAILEDVPDALEWDLDAIIGWPGMSSNRLHYSRTGGIRMSGDAMDAGSSGWAAFAMLDANVLEFDAGGADG